MQRNFKNFFDWSLRSNKRGKDLGHLNETFPANKGTVWSVWRRRTISWKRPHGHIAILFAQPKKERNKQKEMKNLIENSKSRETEISILKCIVIVENRIFLLCISKIEFLNHDDVARCNKCGEKISWLSIKACKYPACKMSYFCICRFGQHLIVCPSN